MHAGVPWGGAVFAAGPRVFTVRDVIYAGQLRGELDSTTAKLELSAARENQAAEERLEPDLQAIAALSEQWRYERDLITAEETERWLEERGLTLDDFNDYFLRQYWRDSPHEDLTVAVDDSFSSDQWQELLRAELVLSGQFDGLAQQLAWRAAARSEAAGATFARPAREQFAPAMEKLASLGVGEEWFEEMLELEAFFQRECAAVLTGEARARALGMLRMPLTRLELEVIDVESRDAAREAASCIREDGASIGDVARDGRYPHQRVETLVDDLPADLQQTFLCAAPGELLGPFERGDGFQLSQLVRKIEPTLGDPQVSRRVDRRILERHFSELAGKHLRWMISPNPPAG